jgi:transposase-like protein
MLSLRRFMERFRDDEACRQYIYKLRWPHGFICPRCGEKRHTHIRARNIYECSFCKTQTSVTAGTIMHRTKLPLTYWLFTFYWMASGELCSARKLSITLNLNYRTALRMLHAVRTAMSNANGHTPFAFWKPAPHAVMRQANRQMRKRAQCFIHTYYRRVAPKNQLSYFSEFWFRSNNQFTPVHALQKLISAASETLRYQYWA